MAEAAKTGTAISRGAVILVLATAGAAPAFAQAQDPTGPWTFSFAPYGWLTFMSGTQTVAGQTEHGEHQRLRDVRGKPIADHLHGLQRSALSGSARPVRRRDVRQPYGWHSATRSFSVPGVSGSAVAVGLGELRFADRAVRRGLRGREGRPRSQRRRSRHGRRRPDGLRRHAGRPLVVPARRHDAELLRHRDGEHAQPLGLGQPQPGLRQFGHHRLGRSLRRLPRAPPADTGTDHRARGRHGRLRHRQPHLGCRRKSPTPSISAAQSASPGRACSAIARSMSTTPRAQARRSSR